MNPQQLLQQAREKRVGQFVTSQLLSEPIKVGEYFGNLKYSKPVLSREQFVPMWCCLPKQTNSGKDMSMSPSDLFSDPRQLEQLGFTHTANWLRNKPMWVRRLVHTIWNLLPRENGNTLWAYLTAMNSSSSLQRAYIASMKKILLAAKGDINTAISCKIYIKNEMETFKPLLFDYTARSQYILPLPHLAYRYQQLRMSVEDILSTAVAATEYRQMGTDPGTFVLRQGYLGKLGEFPNEPQSVHLQVPMRLTTRTNENQYSCYPSNSAIFGLQSYYCLMIRAKYQTKVMLATLRGDTKLELPEGAVELWEQEGIRKKLTGQLLQVYTKQVYGLVRNTMHCTVKIIPDLTRELFDIQKEVITPMNVDSIIQNRLSNGVRLSEELKSSSQRSERFNTYKKA